MPTPLYYDPRFAKDHPANQIPEELFRHTEHKWAAKLSFNERCAILAFHLRGVRKARIASAFKVDRRTVGAICNTQSPHYRDVRAEARNMGVPDFTAKYITTEEIARLQTMVNEAEIAKTTKQLDASKGPDLPDARYKSHEGLHSVDLEPMGQERRTNIFVAWSNEHSCWCFRILDNADPRYEHYHTEFIAERFKKSKDALTFAASEAAGPLYDVK